MTSKTTVFLKGRPLTREIVALAVAAYARIDKGLDLPPDMVRAANDFGMHITYYGGESNAPRI